MNALILALALLAPPTQDGADEVGRLKSEYDAAEVSFYEKYSEAKTDEEKQALVASDYPKPEAYADRFLAIADAHPGTDAAQESFLWIARQVRGPAKEKALAGLLDQFGDSEAIGKVCGTLRYEPSATADRFLRTLHAESPHTKVRGVAAYNLAHILQQSASLSGRLADDEEMATQYREFLGDASVDRLLAADAAALNTEAMELFQLVIAEYGDVDGGRGSLGDVAERDVFEIENLAIGKVAPEIEGEDIDGVTFKLSDYRGRVVLLDFWGDW